MGGKSSFTQDVADVICTKLAEGKSLRAICAAEDMPPESTVRQWAVDDVNGFAAQYARAREVGMDALADELLEIADDGRNDTYLTDDDGVRKVDYDVISRSKLRVDARKWYMSKVAPKKYGDRLDHTHAGPNGEALRLLIGDTAEARK